MRSSFESHEAPNRAPTIYIKDQSEHVLFLHSSCRPTLVTAEPYASCYLPLLSFSGALCAIAVKSRKTSLNVSSPATRYNIIYWGNSRLKTWLGTRQQIAQMVHYVEVCITANCDNCMGLMTVSQASFQTKILDCKSCNKLSKLGYQHLEMCSADKGQPIIFQKQSGLFRWIYNTDVKPGFHDTNIWTEQFYTTTDNNVTCQPDMMSPFTIQNIAISLRLLITKTFAIEHI